MQETFIGDSRTQYKKPKFRNTKTEKKKYLKKITGDKTQKKHKIREKKPQKV